MAIFRNQQGK